MAISRRSFILGTTAGLILPSYYDKVFTFFENHGEPFLDLPKGADTDLFAVDWGSGIIEFHLGEVAEESPGPMAKAYRLLENLDLGSEFESEDAVGQLDFVDCPNPCSSCRGVQTEDPVSVSLLQKRLTDLNTGIRVSMAEVS